MRILLVEDNPAEARLVQEELSEIVDESFDLIWADNLLKAIERLSEKRFDILLLDLTLPDANGLETLYKIQAHAYNIPIIILTRIHDEGMAIEAVKHGAQDYLYKGRIDSTMLLCSIRYAIERHKVLTELNHYIKKLKTSEERFHSMIEKNPNGMVIVDRDNIVRFANKAIENLFGCKLGEFVGESFKYPFALGQITGLKVTKEDGKITELEMETIETEWEGEIVYYLIIRDITKQKQKASLK